MAEEFGAIVQQMDEIIISLGPTQMQPIMHRIGVQAQRDMMEVLSTAIGPDHSFSGWKRLGKLSTNLRVEGPQFTIIPVPYGGWIVADKGRRPGSIAPKRKEIVTMAMPWGPRTYARSKPLKIGPTKGKDVLTKSRILIQLRSPIRLENEIERILRRVVRGTQNRTESGSFDSGFSGGLSTSG